MTLKKTRVGSAQQTSNWMNTHCSECCSMFVTEIWFRRSVAHREIVMAGEVDFGSARMGERMCHPRKLFKSCMRFVQLCRYLIIPKDFLRLYDTSFRKGSPGCHPGKFVDSFLHYFLWYFHRLFIDISFSTLEISIVTSENELHSYLHCVAYLTIFGRGSLESFMNIGVISLVYHRLFRNFMLWGVPRLICYNPFCIFCVFYWSVDIIFMEKIS